ncbi:MAG: hypothetical protein IIY16_02765, partial [Oscillospiraceae bacterium]|nr:hypothetical protein [Oscillospiraceae bacterium]
MKKFLIVLLCLVLVALLVVGSYFLLHKLAGDAADAGDFSKADSLLVLPLMHDELLYVYIDAGLLYEAGQYAEARTAFETLRYYRNSVHFAQESRYECAVILMEAGDYDAAYAEFEILAAMKHENSALKMKEMRCGRAEELMEAGELDEAQEILLELIEEGYEPAVEVNNRVTYAKAELLLDDGDMIAAYEQFTMIRGFDDVDERIAELEADIYARGQRLFRIEKYVESLDYFKCIEHYERSADYILLHDCINYYYGLYLTPEEKVDILLGMLDFENAQDVLFEKHFDPFLIGTWKTADDYYEFTMHGEELEHKVGCSLPYDRTAENYVFIESELNVYAESVIVDDETTYPDAQPIFDFAAIDRNSIEIT